MEVTAVLFSGCDIEDVQTIMKVPKGREKNRLIVLIRNTGNMEAGLHGVVKAAHRVKGQEVNEKTHSLCQHCKAYIKRTNMWKHYAECFANAARSSENKDRFSPAL